MVIHNLAEMLPRIRLSRPLLSHRAAARVGDQRRGMGPGTARRRLFFLLLRLAIVPVASSTPCPSSAPSSHTDRVGGT